MVGCRPPEVGLRGRGPTFFEKLPSEERALEPNTVVQGLYITVAGMGLVFLALGLVVLSIQIMVRTFRPRSGAGEKKSLPESGGEDRARVAVIAAAIVLSAQRNPHHPDDAWRLAGHTETSPWQAAHRTRTPARRTS